MPFWPGLRWSPTGAETAVVARRRGAMLWDERPAALGGASYEPLRSWNARTTAPSPHRDDTGYDSRPSAATLATYALASPGEMLMP